MSTPRKASPLADGQYDRCGIYQQTGRNQVRPTHPAGPGDLKTMPVSQDKPGCPIPSRFGECGGRCRITTNECQDRVDSCQTSVCENSNTLLHPRSRPVRIQAKSPSTNVCGTSPRPGGNGDRCVHLGLEQMDIVHSPSDSSIEQGPTQNSSRQSNGFTNSTGMGGTAVVPVTVGHVGRLSSQTSDITEDNLPSVRPDSGSPIVEDVSSDCMASFRRQMQTTGFSETVCNILFASWRTSTAKRYAGPWKIWVSWCGERQKCPFSATVNDIMEFLAFQFQQRHLAYRTIGVYKSCISQFHDLVEGQPVGSLPVMSRFMKGIFELQPPKPKTSTTWSVGQVLAFLQDMDPFENLSLQDLSLKLAMLLALTSAARVHELIALSLASVIKKQDCWSDRTIQDGRYRFMYIMKILGYVWLHAWSNM